MKSIFDYDIPPRYESNIDEVMAGCLSMVGVIVAAIVGLLLCALMGSCTTTEYVTVEKVRTDTVVQTKVQRDSVIMKDSIHVTERGETIQIDRWHTRYLVKERFDTLYRATHDTIPQPYPVIKEVPADITWWQQTRLHLANILLWAAVIMTVLWIIRKKVWLPW